MGKVLILKAGFSLGAQATLGEGALWHPQHKKLLWVDIENCELHEFDPKSGKDIWWSLPARISTVVPVQTGGYLVALQTGIHHFSPQTGELRLLVNPISDPQIRFNDGKCDPAGRFWVGTIHMEGKANEATLYRYDPDGSLHIMLEALTNSNGIAWTADARTMYFIDTPTQQVQAFDFDNRSGRIYNPRIAVRIPEELGAPDGMTIGADGHIWVALYGGGAVHCYDPANGRLLYRVEVPAPHTTSCAFGGPDLRTLFITTAREKLSERQLRNDPGSGSLFAVSCPVSGVPASCFNLSS